MRCTRCCLRTVRCHSPISVVPFSIVGAILDPFQVSLPSCLECLLNPRYSDDAPLFAVFIITSTSCRETCSSLALSLCAFRFTCSANSVLKCSLIAYTIRRSKIAKRTSSVAPVHRICRGKDAAMLIVPFCGRSYLFNKLVLLCTSYLFSKSIHILLFGLCQIWLPLKSRSARCFFIFQVETSICRPGCASCTSISTKPVSVAILTYSFLRNTTARRS